PILARLGMPADDVDAACALIAHHLLMYVVAVQRDIADTATLDKLLQITRDREGLRDLYLLTVADLSTTSPTSMTTWKAGMLDALMRRGEARLSELPADPGDRLSRARAQVKVAWAGRGAPEEIDAFLDGMPERYLLATPPAVVIEHARAALGREIDAITATLLPSPHAEVAQLCVVTDAKAGSSLCVVAPDQPGLLASIAAAISANGLEIHAAEINTRPLAEGGVQAVDVFWVRSPRGVSGIAERLGRLQHDLRQSITGQVNHAQLLARATGSWPTARSLPPVFTEIVLDHAASHEHTVIEVLTADRPGLLFTLSQALHEIGISIHLAKINTEGSRVIDVFYVTGSDGKKLAPGEPSERVRQHLHAALLD
ncbi:MAG TPA: [protein-PII] uridylyltransferase, partial [Polyangiales bacterium]|nr:[protein-PII] uridylyltransferase [Polyangiales bacterium]